MDNRGEVIDVVRSVLLSHRPASCNFTPTASAGRGAFSRDITHSGHQALSQALFENIVWQAGAGDHQLMPEDDPQAE